MEALGTNSAFYNRYKETILFNKNLVIAGTCSLILAPLFAQTLFAQSTSNELANIKYSVLTLLIECGIGIPIFALLYYNDNKCRYSDPITGKKDSHLLRADIKKLLAAFTISGLTYSVAKISIQYQLLQADLEPFQAALFSSAVGWLLFFLIINVSMKVVSEFKKQQAFYYYLLILSIVVADSIIIFSDVQSRTLYTNLIIDTTSAIALFSSLLIVGRHKGRNLKGKTFEALAIGLALWFIAQLTWTYYQLGLGIETPFPSLADAFWLAGYAFLAYHLYRLYNFLNRGTERHLVILISLAIALGLGYTLNLTFGVAQLLSAQEDILTPLVSILYPIFDGILLVPAIVILWSLRKGDPSLTHWVLIAVFIILNTIADIGFNYSVVFDIRTA
ncbi:MAG: hypothetical protein M3530_07065, partial [Thermoproteota archaeon]|nr:hypothetical protein [Thermoproteota archaeon]